MAMFFGIILCVILYFSTLGVCYFERGDRYWSGRPNAIGIDFSTTTVTAMLTDGTNFTTLAILPVRQNYITAMYRIHEERRKSHFHSVFIDDDLPSISKLEQWKEEATSWILVKKSEWTEHACDKLTQTFPLWDTLYEKCYLEKYTYNPQPPRVPNKGFITRLRAQKRLRALLPKWFRTTSTDNILLKSEFLALLVDILKEIKSTAFEDHGIIIKSATISRPNVFYNELSDLIDEACAIAEIESWDQSYDRTEMALKTMTIPNNGTVMIVDHSPYFFNIYNAEWYERERIYRTTGSSGDSRSGGWQILHSLVTRVIGIHNSNVTKEDRGWPLRVDKGQLFGEIANAQFYINYGSDWPEEMERINRTVTLNLTDIVDHSTIQVNVTGRELAEVEEFWINEFVEKIERNLWIDDYIIEYRKSVSYHGEDLPRKPRHEQTMDIVYNKTAPQLLGSFLAAPDHIIVMDTGLDSEIIKRAILKATGNEVVIEDRGICFPQYNYAVRGAALRALEWQEYWEYDSDANPDYHDEYTEMEKMELEEEEDSHQPWDEI